MRDSPRLLANYQRLDRTLAADQDAARARGDTGKVDQIQRDRDDLARSFTVLLFGQFEQTVNETFEAVRDRMKAHPAWQSRRGWDTDFLRRPVWRIPLADRLAVVMDRGDPDFQRIQDNFAIHRHGFAHGVLTSVPTPPAALVTTLYIYQSKLRS